MADLKELLAQRKAEKEAKGKADGGKVSSSSEEPVREISDDSKTEKVASKNPFGKRTIEPESNKSGNKTENAENVSEAPSKVLFAKPGIKNDSTSNSPGKSLFEKSKLATDKARDEEFNATIAKESFSEETFILNEQIHNLPNFDADKFIDNMANINARMDKNVPGMKNFLRDILNDMKRYEDLAYLLSDEQIGLIVGGLLKEQKLELVTKKKANSLGQDKDLVRFF